MCNPKSYWINLNRPKIGTNLDAASKKRSAGISLLTTAFAASCQAAVTSGKKGAAINVLCNLRFSQLMTTHLSRPVSRTRRVHHHETETYQLRWPNRKPEQSFYRNISCSARLRSASTVCGECTTWNVTPGDNDECHSAKALATVRRAEQTLEQCPHTLQARAIGGPLLGLGAPAGAASNYFKRGLDAAH